LEPEDGLAQRALPHDRNLSEFAVKLGSGATLSEIFPQPPLAKHLHVIVKLPTGESG